MGTIQRASVAVAAFSRTTRFGAARLVGVYAAAFLLYAILRSSVEVFIAADTDLLLLLLTNAVSLLLSGLAVAAMMLVVAVPSGVMTMALIGWLLRHLHPAHTRWQAGMLGTAAALVVQGALHLGAGFPFATAPVETWLFWIGLPTVVHIGAAGAATAYRDRFSAVEEGSSRTQTRTIRTVVPW